MDRSGPVIHPASSRMIQITLINSPHLSRPVAIWILLTILAKLLFPKFSPSLLLINLYPKPLLPFYKSLTAKVKAVAAMAERRRASNRRRRHNKDQQR